MPQHTYTQAALELIGEEFCRTLAERTLAKWREQGATGETYSGYLNQTIFCGTDGRRVAVSTMAEAPAEARSELAGVPRTPFAVPLEPLFPPATTTYSANKQAGYGAFERTLPQVPHLPDLARPFFGAVVQGGPKVFQTRDCEALENVLIHLTPAEAKLPYPVCVVEYPAAYQQTLVEERVGRLRPLFTIVVQRLDGGIRTLTAGSQAGREVVCGLVRTDFPADQPVETTLTQTTADANKYVARVALNFLLVAANHHWTTRPANAARREHLTMQLKQARRKRNHRREAELAAKLRGLPDITVRELDRTVRLFVRE